MQLSKEFSSLPSRYMKSISLCLNKSLQYSFIRRYCSALFITNDKLSKICSTVVPQYDVDSVITNKNEIIKNITRRKQDPSKYDFNKIENYYKKYKVVQSNITDLENKIILTEAEKIQSSKEVYEKNKLLINQMRNELKQYEPVITEFQKEVVIANILKLPNTLDMNTPDDYELIFDCDRDTEAYTKMQNQHNTQIPEEKFSNNESILNDVEYVNKLDITYLNRIAKIKYLFPIAIENYFIQAHNYIPFTNSDLCKSVIIEGSGAELNDAHSSIPLANNEYEPGSLGYEEFRYYLTGCSHLNMFTAYHTNHSVNYKDLPLKYITFGKQYNFNSLIPDYDNSNIFSDKENIFNCIQKDNINIFIGTDNDKKVYIEFDNIQESIQNILNILNIKYRIVRIPAYVLKHYETYKLEFHAYSNIINKWVICGDISIINDYISKRLNICYHKNQTSYDKHFIHIVSSNIYTHVLINVLNENNNIPDLNLLQQSLIRKQTNLI